MPLSRGKLKTKFSCKNSQIQGGFGWLKVLERRSKKKVKVFVIKTRKRKKTRPKYS